LVADPRKDHQKAGSRRLFFAPESGDGKLTLP
jgi:hypothetical protein